MIGLFYPIVTSEFINMYKQHYKHKSIKTDFHNFRSVANPYFNAAICCVY